jgi:hypothetical protein
MGYKFGRYSNNSKLLCIDFECPEQKFSNSVNQNYSNSMSLDYISISELKRKVRIAVLNSTHPNLPTGQLPPVPNQRVFQTYGKSKGLSIDINEDSSGKLEIEISTLLYFEKEGKYGNEELQKALQKARSELEAATDDFVEFDIYGSFVFMGAFSCGIKVTVGSSLDEVEVDFDPFMTQFFAQSPVYGNVRLGLLEATLSGEAKFEGSLGLATCSPLTLKQTPYDNNCFYGVPENVPKYISMVKIQLPGDTYLHLAEIEVYENQTNVALNKQANMSSVYDLNYYPDPQAGVDGVIEGSLFHTGRAENENPWWEVDLTHFRNGTSTGLRYLVTKVVIHNRNYICDENCQARLSNATILLIDSQGDVVDSQTLGDMRGKDKAELEFVPIIRNTTRILNRENFTTSGLTFTRARGLGPLYYNRESSGQLVGRITSSITGVPGINLGDGLELKIIDNDILTPGVDTLDFLPAFKPFEDMKKFSSQNAIGELVWLTLYVTKRIK